jgi:hypothetical protein
MAAKKPKKQITVAIAATSEDLKLIQFLREKLGLDRSGVIRYCLRRIVDQERAA